MVKKWFHRETRIFFIYFFIVKVLAQPKSPSSDYKYVLRIQRGIESEVGFYLDEPMTGDLKSSQGKHGVSLLSK